MTRRHERTLDHLIGSCIRARLLERLLREPGEVTHLSQLTGAAGASVSFTRGELAELERMRLVHSLRVGGILMFEVRQCHPLVQPLRDLVRACDRVDAGIGPQREPWRMPYEPGSAVFQPITGDRRHGRARWKGSPSAARQGEHG